MNEKDRPSMVDFHVAAQMRGFASLLHSQPLVLARPCANSGLWVFVGCSLIFY